MQVRLASLILVAAATFAASDACGQGGMLDPGPAGNEGQTQQRPAEYSTTVGKMTPLEIIQAKAQARAAQRAAILASRQWYGYSQARPNTTATPFSGMYGAQFHGQSFARPAAHYAQRPIIVVTR